jgi:receptor protein-tyrosine kinase
LALVLAASTAFYISKQLTPIYATSATLLVNQTQTAGTVQYNDILTSERLTNTYTELVKRQMILQSVIRRLDLPMTFPELSSKMSVSAIPNTQLLRITIEDRPGSRFDHREHDRTGVHRR